MRSFHQSFLVTLLCLGSLPTWADDAMSCPVQQPRAPLSRLERMARMEAERNALVPVLADSIEGKKDGLMQLDGAVEMIRGTNRIQADHLRYQQPLDKAEASGDVQLHHGDDLTFYTDQLNIDLDAQVGET